ncbi:MAG: WecB/TagA/CpsF family glycosyltransferase [Planctomycetia bacterium]|nr:WecB/TagA/CpsF family glycosyltransferase [Planctomycetia bacterium]
MSVADLAEDQAVPTDLCTKSESPKRVSLFGVAMDPLRMTEAIARIQGWISHREGRCQYVVTPNVQHSVMLQQHEGLKAAYSEAGLVLADGQPVVMASRLLGRPLPERVAGSDLLPALMASAQPNAPLRLFLLGAAPGVAARAAVQIASRWPAVQVVGTYSPPLGFEHQPEENQRILARIKAAKPDVVAVGLGAPKQELWVHRHCHEIAAPVALCIGATIDFLAGEKPRAPRWMRGLGLEWLHRCASEPRRLLKRYAHDAVAFPQLVWREWRAA